MSDKPPFKAYMYPVRVFEGSAGEWMVVIGSHIDDIKILMVTSDQQAAHLMAAQMEHAMSAIFMWASCGEPANGNNGKGTIP